MVRFQHRHYVPIALFSGLILPWLIAHFGWNDGLGGLIWGGAVARLLIWYVASVKVVHWWMLKCIKAHYILHQLAGPLDRLATVHRGGLGKGKLRESA